MNALELMQKRCSIRDYLSTPIEKDKIEYLLEAARMAPSACNFQPWTFLLITEEEGRTKLGECYKRDWIKQAPLFIVICGDHSQSWKRPQDGKDHLDVDMGIVTEHICLAATELGLATCIVCHFNAALFSSHFSLPESIEPVVIIPVAYPAHADLFENTPKKRKSMDEIVRWEKF